MPKQQVKQTKTPNIAEADLRKLVAGWVREALGSLVEGHERELDRVVAASKVMLYSNEKRAGCVERVGQCFDPRRVESERD